MTATGIAEQDGFEPAGELGPRGWRASWSKKVSANRFSIESWKHGRQLPASSDSRLAGLFG